VRKGVWLGAAAYSLWGLFPLYWRQIESISALEIIAHRITWSFIVLIVIVALRRRARRADAAGPPGLTVASASLYAIASVLIGLNWYFYVWGVNHRLVVGTSLGYFITPLVNVLLGVLILRESLRPLQWLAVAIAASGVCYLWWAYGTLPWIALALAGTFGTYGLVKKKASLSPLSGLTLETAILFLPAVILLAVLERSGAAAFGHAGARVTLLLAGAGIVTTVPLLLFASAAQRIPLSVLGILQYISPTIQFLLGLFVYREPFTRVQLVGFTAVWIALAIFAVDGLRATAYGRRATRMVVGAK
jgi:chloramphenicol-sensitive protein RarD